MWLCTQLEDLDDDEEEEDEDETEEEGGEDEECDGLMPDIMAWELDTLEIPGKPELKEDPQVLGHALTINLLYTIPSSITWLLRLEQILRRRCSRRSAEWQRISWAIGPTNLPMAT